MRGERPGLKGREGWMAFDEVLLEEMMVEVEQKLLPELRRPLGCFGAAAAPVHVWPGHSSWQWDWCGQPTPHVVHARVDPMMYDRGPCLLCQC